MSFWDQFKKKPAVDEANEYRREKSQYNTPGEDGRAEGSELRSPEANPDALTKLYEDVEVKAKMEAELGRSKDHQKQSFQSMLGKGATTLGKSIKNVSNGQGVLDEDDERQKK